MGLREVAGYYTQLQRGFLELGYTCRVAQYQAHPMCYPIDTVKFPFLDTVSKLHLKAMRVSTMLLRLPLLFLWFFGWQILRWFLFFWALLTHEVFVLRAMVPILPLYLELPILRFAGRKVIMTYHGTEGRPAFMNGKLMQSDSALIRFLVPVLCWVQRRLIRYADRFCDVIVDHTASGMYHEKPFLKYLSAGVPMEVNTCEYSPPPNQTRIKALHCPSNILIKGSDRIRAAVSEVRQRGVDIELIELSGKPNHIILDAIRDCDFVIDEVFSDSPMAAFAAEAASKGRAAIIGGYYGESITEDVPVEMIPPSKFVSPEELTNTIEFLARNHHACQEIGQQAFCYIRDHWTPAHVCRRILQTLEGQAPDEWIFDPAQSGYIFGYGISKDVFYKKVSKLVKRRGIGVLQLQGRSRMLQAIQSFLISRNDDTKVDK